MNKLLLACTLFFSAAALATTGGCTEPDATIAAGRVIIDQPCAADTDCPAGFECEIEVEQGVTTSFCQSDDEHSDGTCPAGFELETEHGQNVCQPHGDGDGSGSGSADDDGDDDGAGDDDGGTGTGQVGDACAADTDCGAGLECEIELEHGVSTASCQPHGGN